MATEPNFNDLFDQMARAAFDFDQLTDDYGLVDKTLESGDNKSTHLSPDARSISTRHDGNGWDWTGLGLRSNSVPKSAQTTSMVNTPRTRIDVNESAQTPVVNSLDDHESSSHMKSVVYGPSTPRSQVCERLYEKGRDPRLSTPRTPMFSESSSSMQHSPNSPCAYRSAVPFQVTVVDGIDHTDADSDMEESIEDEESFHDSFDANQLEVPEPRHVPTSSKSIKNKLPLLLYRTWNEGSGGFNSGDEFRPGLAIQGPPPEPPDWDEETISHAANHFNIEITPTPFVSFTISIAMVVKYALRAMVKDKVNPVITLVTTKPLRETLMAASPLCNAVKTHNLANTRTRRYAASSEFLHWGAIRASDHTEHVFLANVPLARLFTLSTEHSGVQRILRLELWKTDKSVRTIVSKVAEDVTVCDEDIASGIALIAIEFGFNLASDQEHLREFIMQLARGFGIKPCSPENKDVVKEAFVKALVSGSSSLGTVVHNGIQAGYNRLVAWVENRANSLAQHEAIKGKVKDAVPQKIPFGDQEYRGRTGKIQSTTRFMRSASKASREERKPKQESTSRTRVKSPYHDRRRVKTTPIVTDRRKRKFDDVDDQTSDAKT